MITTVRPRFEVVVGTASADERRLVSLATVRALTGLTEATVSNATLTLLIDTALAECARYCRLARAGSAPRTFAREIVRATWPADLYRSDYWRPPMVPCHTPQIILPWRVPIVAITVTEGDRELVKNTDYQLQSGSAIVERLAGGYWPTTGPLVVDYTAGWVPEPADPSYDDGEDPMPADLVAAIANQVKLTFIQGTNDPTLRSEDVPGIWSGTYNVPGGDTIADDGLLHSLRCALDPYKNPPAFA
jgi:hypothetical protein